MFGYQLPELKNVIDMFHWNSLFTTKEKDEIELSMAYLIDNLIEGDPLGYSCPKFESNLKEYVLKNTLLVMKEIHGETHLEKQLIEGEFAVRNVAFSNSKSVLYVPWGNNLLVKN